MNQLIEILFAFAIGACIGSFLNVVVYRLPRGISLVSPPSHCPQCNKLLPWFDNVPVIGWIHLRGKCRYCRQPISMRYPAVEAFCGGMFAFYYYLFFVLNIGPIPDAGAERSRWPAFVLSLSADWPIYALYLYLLCALLAASLIDIERYEIPIDILWSWKGGVVWVGLIAHAVMDCPTLAGNLLADGVRGALAAGGVVGLIVSVVLLYVKVLPRSFAEGMPMLEIERERERKMAGDPQSAGAAGVGEEEFTPQRIRAEMRKEMLFLLLPMITAFIFLLLTLRMPMAGRAWAGVMGHQWIAALLGSAFGGLIGGLVVWAIRIAATCAFGREAMGLGDMHLMVGVGVVIGAGAATVAFLLSPFFGLVLAIYMLLTGTRRELPFGPYLSMATAFLMLFYPPIAQYLAQGLTGLGWLIMQWMGVRPSFP